MNVMTCREMEILLRDLARQSQGLEPREEMSSDVAAHLDACPRCSSDFERERRLTASLAALAGSIGDSASPPAIPAMQTNMEAALRAAFREHRRDRPNHRTHSGRRVFEIPAGKPLQWVAGAAAILVVSLGVALIEWQPSGVPSGEPPRIPMQSLLAPTASLANPQEVAPATIPIVRRPETAGLNPSTADAAKPTAGAFARRPGNDLASADATSVAKTVYSPAATALPEAEQAVLQPSPQVRSEFVPLFYGGDPQLLEAGQVWRVEMPRSALQSVGMPVVEESRAGRIQVDILLGEDGIARAIRLVP